MQQLRVEYVRLLWGRIRHTGGLYTTIDTIPCGSLGGDEVILLQFVQIVSDRPVGLWIVDAVPVLLIEISPGDL